MSDSNQLSLYRAAEKDGTSANIVTEMGKALGMMLGVNPASGYGYAVTCYCENLTPLEFIRTYDLIEGKPSMKTDAMMAKFLERGGKIEIVERSADAAEVKMTSKQMGTQSFRLTWEEVQKEGYVYARGGGNGKGFKPTWGTPRGRTGMMFKRVISEGVRVMDVAIVAGIYSPEEVADFIDGEVVSSQVSTSAISPPLAAPATTAKQPERQTPPPVTTGQTTSPVPTQSAPATSAKSITLDSMTSAIEFAKRAFTGFAKEPKISTIGQLVKYTREELIARESMGETTVKNIEVELSKHGFKLKESSPLVTDQSGSGSATDAESGTPEASTDAAALAARGLELAEDSDANHSDNDHGAAIAEIREICTDAKLKETAKAVMGERCGGKTSLADLSHLETSIVLVYLLAIQCGIPVEKIDGVCDKINSDSDPIARASVNIADLKKRLGKN